MACLEQKGLYDVPSESNDDESTPGIVSSVLNSVVEGAELCLTSENSDAWLTGRPSTLLPQPIQDICTLATHLGFRYAWVDALCIMQGPDGDWHREAMKMAAIYMNAKFTVAAADETPLAKAAPVQDFILDSYRLITPDNPKMHHENGIYSELRDTKNIFFREDGVLDYTERSFSYGTDRLIALDGIISRLTQILEDTCLVGIWRKDAIRCLNWIATSDETNPARPDIEAPSWSWLSVNGRISYNFRNPRWGYLEEEDDPHVPMAVVEYISAQTEDKRTFAKFSGELRIRGPVISGYVLERTVFFETQRDQTLPSTSKDGTENTRQMLLHEKSRLEEERAFRHEPLLWDPRPSGPKDNDFRGPLALPSTKNDHLQVAEVKCLLLCEYNEWNNHYTWKTQNYVVLERINGRLGQGLPDISGRKPVYRRIGICTVE
ncbi:hypothetical protein PG989_013663, partial [Apiospora arundinis]